MHLSYGGEEPEEYLRQVLADHVVPAWDRVVAVLWGQAVRPGAGAVAEWFTAREEMSRPGGLIGDRAQSRSGHPQNRLLAALDAIPPGFRHPAELRAGPAEPPDDEPSVLRYGRPRGNRLRTSARGLSGNDNSEDTAGTVWGAVCYCLGVSVD
jgi:hypothetical protein